MFMHHRRRFAAPAMLVAPVLHSTTRKSCEVVVYLYTIGTNETWSLLADLLVIHPLGASANPSETCSVESLASHALPC